MLDPAITPAQGTLAVGLAVAGTLAEVIVHVQRPAEDVWQAGREYGRREAIRESSCAPVSLSAARRRRKARQDMSRLG